MEKTGTIIYIPKKIHAKPVDRNNSLKDCLPSLDEPPPPVRSHEDVLENFQLKGRDTVKDFLLGSFFLFPDEVHLYSDIKICKRLNESGSRIIGSVEKLGTMIYLPKEINGEPVDRNNTLRDCLPALDSLPPPIHCQEDIVNNFQLSLQPLRMRSRSNYQIVLDENHRITSLYMYYYDLTFTPLPLDEVHRD
eukprot:gene5722-6150_t